MAEYTWHQASQYMTALHELKRWVERETDKAQLMEPLTDTLPAAWEKVEKMRGELMTSG